MPATFTGDRFHSTMCFHGECGWCQSEDYTTDSHSKDPAHVSLNGITQFTKSSEQQNCSTLIQALWSAHRCTSLKWCSIHLAVVTYTLSPIIRVGTMHTQSALYTCLICSHTHSCLHLCSVQSCLLTCVWTDMEHALQCTSAVGTLPPINICTNNIYTFQWDTQCSSTDCLLMLRCQLYMFRTVTVHPQDLLF